MSDDVPTNGPTARAVPTLPRQRQWLTVVLLLVIFVSGGLIGASLKVLLKPEPARKGPPGSAAEFRDRQTNTIAEMVSLSAEQKEKVRRVVEEVWVSESLAIMEKTRPRNLQMYERLNKEILRILDEKQRRKWMEYYRKRVVWWSRSFPTTQPITQPTMRP